MSFSQKCIVLALAVVIFGGAAYFIRVLIRPERWAHYQSIPWVQYVHPNVKKLKDAQALVGEGKLEQARAILVEALTTAPNSPVTRQLRDLLGDVNTESFFSKEPSARKIQYTVKRGDTLSSIARKLKSSPDLIMRINNLSSTLIRPGETLFVPDLNFTITIDLPRDRVVVHDSHGFFTQYPIASTDLPHTRKPVFETKVRAKSFWENGRPVRPTLGPEQKGTPWIYLSRPAYVLYGVEEDSDTSDSEIDVTKEETETEPDSAVSKQPTQGIAMLEKDIMELQLLIRKGTPVTIIINSAQRK
jgi:LysM repeat protein